MSIHFQNCYFDGIPYFQTNPFEFTITILWDICQALWQKEFDAEPYVVPSTYQYCINTWSAVQCLVHLSICLSRINEFTWGFLSHNEVMIWWWSELGYSVKWSTVKTLAVVVVIDSLEAYANRGQTVVKKRGNSTTETIFAARDIWLQDVTREFWKKELIDRVYQQLAVRFLGRTSKNLQKTLAKDITEMPIFGR